MEIPRRLVSLAAASVGALHPRIRRGRPRRGAVRLETGKRFVACGRPANSGSPPFRAVGTKQRRLLLERPHLEEEKVEEGKRRRRAEYVGPRQPATPLCVTRQPQTPRRCGGRERQQPPTVLNVPTMGGAQTTATAAGCTLCFIRDRARRGAALADAGTMAVLAALVRPAATAAATAAAAVTAGTPLAAGAARPGATVLRGRPRASLPARLFATSRVVIGRVHARIVVAADGSPGG